MAQVSPDSNGTSSTNDASQISRKQADKARGPHFNIRSFPGLRNARLKLVRPRGTGYAVPEFSRACLIRLIDFPEMPFRTGVSDTIKAGNSALVVRTEFPIAGKMTSVAYKHVRRRTWIKRLTQLFRPHRVLRTWKLAHLLLARGIATARPLAVIVPRTARLSGDGYLISEWIDGAVQPIEFGRVLRPYKPHSHERRMHHAACALGELLGRMHAAKISHRDLKSANVLLQDQPDGVAAYIIDLDGAALRARIRRRTRIRDLSRLAVGLDGCADANLATRLRFLKSYLAVAGDVTWEWKTAWHDLSAATIARRSRRDLKKSKKSMQ